jgi:SAM-dependent methyltransferase
MPVRPVDLVLSDRFVGGWRRLATAGAHGTVVEFGFGSGLNLPHYPTAVREVLAVEPDDDAWAAALDSGRIDAFAQARGASPATAVRRVGLDAAEVDLPDGFTDAVVATWTLCSIPAVSQALAQARRLLTPDGALHVVKHALAPSPRVAAVQRRIQPAWGRVAGGCHLDRDIPALLEEAGFGAEGLRRRYAVRGAPLRPWTWFVAGAARPR